MFQDYPDILTPVQASKALRIGTKTFYSLIRERKLGHIRIGKKILVPRHCLVDFVKSEHNPLFVASDAASDCHRKEIEL